VVVGGAHRIAPGKKKKGKSIFLKEDRGRGRSPSSKWIDSKLRLIEFSSVVKEGYRLTLFFFLNIYI
jgi:hypothetical protein